MTPDKIAETVENLTDRQRWQHMLALGKRAAGEPALRGAIAALAASTNFYRRRLAMMATWATADQDAICAALQGPSSRLAALACRQAALHVDDDKIAQLLPILARMRRRQLVRACAAAGRTAPIDRDFGQLTLRDRCEFVAFASADFAHSQLADSEFTEQFSPLDWSRVAQRHPDLAIPLLLERSDVPSWHREQAIYRGIQRAMPTSPSAALNILRQAAETIPMWRLPYGLTTGRYPMETAQLVLADKAELVPEIAPKVLRRVDAETCRALIARGAVRLSPRIFRQLTPAVRQSLYAHGALEALRDQASVLDIGYVGLLPTAERVVEAQRSWAAPMNMAIPERRLPYLALLRFDDAMRSGAEFLAQPDANLRAMAGSAVVASTRYDPERLSDALAFVRTRKNEQDPVRLRLIDALAQLPPRRWTAAHLAEISKILADALAARDCSAATIFTAARWLIGLAPHHVEFAARELGRLSERLGQVPSVDLQNRISDAQMLALTPHFLPLLEVWRARDYNGPVLSLLGNFGRRLLAAPQLLSFLERLTGDKRRHVAEGALAILVGIRAKDRLRSLVPQLLGEDPSWILSSTVANHVDRYQQDLLREHLRPRVYKGRFSTNKAAALPNFAGVFWRWSEKQQQLYAQSLLDVANSSQRSAWELRRCLHVLAKMPAIDPAPIVELAQLETKDTALRDMAVVCLGQLDDARGMPCLVSALADDRGRVAIYALRRIILSQAPDSAIDLLQQVPTHKVTIAKEVARLAGELDGEGAYRFLKELLAKPDLHRDVRIALMRALWSHLESDETWDLFAQESLADSAAAVATVSVPQERLSRHARVRLAQHLALLFGHPDPRVRREALKRLVDFPVPANGSELGLRLRKLLVNPDVQEAGLAAAALVLSADARDAAGLAVTFADIESPRTLQAAVAALIERNPFQGDRIRPTAERMVQILLSKRRHTGLAMRLAVHTFSSPALEAAVEDASTSGGLHAGALIEILSALQIAARRRRGADIEAIEPAFAKSLDPMVRRAGLAILVERASVAGWTEHARKRLGIYRSDPDALVNEAASLIFPPEEPSTSQTQ